MSRVCFLSFLLLAVAGCSDNNEGAENDSALEAGRLEGEQIATSDVQGNEGECEAIVNPENWPAQATTVRRDPVIEKEIQRLLSKMTLEEKVGQVIQPDINSIRPKDVKKFNIGSVLNGGNSAPNGDSRAAPEEWLKLADAFWEASVDASDGGVRIPLLWGTDAVHGHNNIVGATVFPHNIGLGAANDPELMRRIAEVTATEIRVTGMDWTFAPTVAVARNDKWGRAYESYSENPAIVEAYAREIVRGLQGELNSESFLKGRNLISTAKHFVGDGGTHMGIDQGDSRVSEAEMRDIHAAAYPVVVREGVQTVMASFNSWCGKKMHGNKDILTTVLRDRMGFDGFVVGDWNGHGQVEGCSKESCAQSFNAGLDMFMAPDSWKGLYHNTLEQVKKGEITMARLDEAVSRILRVKFRAGLFTAKKPSEREFAGEYELLGSAEHRAVAREAVRKSLVLLKNNHSILPLERKQNVLVAGPGADDIGMQSGGWTLSWQGTGNKNSDFPTGQSIFDGIKDQVERAGGEAFLNQKGEYTAKPDVAIVVFGERPYAEFRGDRDTLDYPYDDGIKILKKLKNEDIPTVSVFLSGRPLFVNPELNASDAFVAAWLPGSQGAGVADVLFRKVDGSVNYNFVGKLSFSWPQTAIEFELNVGDEDYKPLFAVGYGLDASDKTMMVALSEESGLDGYINTLSVGLIASGSPVGTWKKYLEDDGGIVDVRASSTDSAAAALSLKAIDDTAQEDVAAFQWADAAAFFVEGGAALDLEKMANEGYVLQLRYRVLGDSVGKTVLSLRCGKKACSKGLDLTKQLAGRLNSGWQVSEIGLSCFSDVGAKLSEATSPLMVSSHAPTIFHLSDVALIKRAALTQCRL